MAYHINLKGITLGDYAYTLSQLDLIPSRRFLKVELKSIFEKLSVIGIQNLYELQKILNRKEKLLALAESNDLDVDYLNVLRREIASNCPKAVPLKEFIGVYEHVVASLANNGIKTSMHLFELARSLDDRVNLAAKLDLSLKEIDKLSRLTDLVRIRWVNHTFANVLYNIGVDTSFKVSQSRANDLFGNIKEMNEKDKLYKGNISLSDIALCINAAKIVPQDMSF